MNLTTTWQQGRFLDNPKYDHMGEDWKIERSREEVRLVRPSPDGNAICQTQNPTDARWIAKRLNLAADLEQLTYDFATGKIDGSEIFEYVKNHIDI